MTLGRTIPALPARDVAQAVAFYTDKLRFQVLHHDSGFAVLRRDEAVLHLWQSDDESWTTRSGGAASPVSSGAESFLAGTASCRIEVTDVDALFTEMQAAGVLHPVSRHGVDETDYGTREFSVLDSDGNLIGFHVWVDRRGRWHP
jgi:catechol 2,3-dioxygenase-like lactoylglutathione lyase family enzyme